MLYQDLSTFREILQIELNLEITYVDLDNHTQHVNLKWLTHCLAEQIDIGYVEVRFYLYDLEYNFKQLGSGLIILSCSVAWLPKLTCYLEVWLC